MDANAWINIFRGLSLWGAILGAIAVAVGTFGSQFCSSLIEKQRHEAIVSKDEKIISLQEALQVKTEEIKALSDRTNASVTGGDSFCYISFALSDDSNQARLVAMSHGNYPVYDAAVRIVDLEKFENAGSKEKISFEELTREDINIPIGNMAPSAASLLNKIDLGSSNEKKYNVFISARNGFFSELIRLRRVDGRWRIAIRVVKDNNNKESVLFEQVDEKFPRLENGAVDWK